VAAGRRHLIHDLRGMSRLAIEATTGVTDLVESMHRTIAGGPAILGSPLAVPASLVIAPVYGSIRGITRLVGASIDVALAQCARLIDEHAPPVEQETVLSALNGVVGDYLFASRNPLAMPMCFRREYSPLVLDRDSLQSALPAASGKLVVFVHGSSMNDRQWRREGHDHGTALEQDLGVTSVHLLYNSGLHVSTNGRAFAALMEQLVAEWPVPLTELTIVGHSMGGLVARSACHYAEEAALPWRAKLGRLVCLGTPHHGAPLERGGNWLGLLLGISRYSAPFKKLAHIRSAGVTDLRYGNVLDEHWAGRDRFGHHRDPRGTLSLPAGVDCFFVAASTSPEAGAGLRGDGLVSVDSALGKHSQPGLTLAVPEAHQLVVYRTNHLGLLSSDVVYGALRHFISAT
jgi:pimeloyl-ACP methyl ester carboxylesterase